MRRRSGGGGSSRVFIVFLRLVIGYGFIDIFCELLICYQNSHTCFHCTKSIIAVLKPILLFSYITKFQAFRGKDL